MSEKTGHLHQAGRFAGECCVNCGVKLCSSVSPNGKGYCNQEKGHQGHCTDTRFRNSGNWRVDGSTTFWTDLPEDSHQNFTREDKLIMRLQGELLLAKALLKQVFRERGIMLKPEANREMGNIAKAIGFSIEEVKTFIRPIIQEIVDELFGKESSE